MKRATTKMASLRSNVENETGHAALLRGKAGVKTTSRNVLSNIGNKPANVLNQERINKGLKPARIVQKPKLVLNRRPATRSSKSTENVAEQPPPAEVVMEDVEMAEVVNEMASAGFSTNNLDDIDKDDAENPQLVVEYVNEIYAYLRHLENEQNVREDYLNKTKTILPKMRAVLVDWLIEVHKQFSLLQETLYLTIAILDRYLQNVCDKVERKKLQLVGVTSMFIASKYEEMYAPEIGDFVYITDQAYTESEIRDMETKILGTLAFELGRPLPLHFLRRNSKAGSVDALTHTLAKYAMELTLVDYNMVHVKPSMLAASALALSLKVFDQDDKPIRELWNPTLTHYTSYNFDQISETIEKLANLLLTNSKADPKKDKLMSVRKKYEDKKLSKIALLAQLTGHTMEQLARGEF
jgi:hypothetical protein